jgi:hypothetical protein
MRPFQSGLDIVRKSPGRHKIAIVQTTIIDGEARLIRLTMVLAHSSGKCVSSDWQVCPFAETASPHRMGAALTNARLLRFSRWFGIAGKDDLDAADLGAAPKTNSRPDPIIGASRMGMLLVRLAIARSPSCVRQDPFSRPTNWQFFGNARSRKCLPLIRPMMRPPGRIGIFSSQRAIQFSVQSVMPAASRIPPPRSVYDERGLTCSTAHHDRIRP